MKKCSECGFTDGHCGSCSKRSVLGAAESAEGKAGAEVMTTEELRGLFEK